MKHSYKMKTLLGTISLIIILVGAHRVQAQNSNLGEEIKFLGNVGIAGAYGLQNHSVNFKGLPDVPSCCPTYSTGNGNGLSLGGLYEFPVSTYLSFEIRGLLSTLGGTLKASETKLVFDGSSSVNGVFEHTIRSKFTSIDLLPSIRFSVMKGLKINVGIGAGWITGATYTQEERLITPSDLLFENDSRSRLNYSGTISKVNNFQLRAVGGLSYDLPLNANETMIAAPEISYSLGFMDVLQTATWKANSLRVGISLKYAWYKYPELIESTLDKPSLPEPEAPELTLKRVVISGSASGEFQDEVGNPAKAQILDIKNITSTNVSALVNYVFFDDSSAVIPPRYTLLNRGEVDNFLLKDLEGTGTLPIYYNILNVIGSRMKLYSDATIILTGCLSGGDSEKDKLRLSKDRVDAVKEYLTDTWGIDPKRIAAKYRGLPDVPSNVKNEDGLAENRRVEITSKTWEILDVLSFNDTVRQLSVPIIALKADAKAELGIEKWRITASQDKKTLKQFTGVSDIPSEKFIWDLAKEPQSIPKQGDPISLSIDVTDREGNTATIKGESIKIKQFYDQKERIETFSLIIFGFNLSSVNESNQRILEMIKGRITPKSIVTVTGFTDRTGATDYNQKLSDRRAKEIGKMLKVKEDNATGRGGDELLYDNDLPEGRFYCRTVRVTVETPLE